MGLKGTDDLLIVACKLVNLVDFREDDNDDFNITENIKIECFFKQSVLAFRESNMAASKVLNVFHHHLVLSHFKYFLHQRWDV
jgi:hypothetical protein